MDKNGFALKHVPSILKQRPGVTAFYQFPVHLLRRYQYFNPGICEWKGVRWLVVRRRRVDIHPGKNTVTLWHLDQFHRPIKELPVRFYSIRHDEHYEDPRAMVKDGTLFLSCSHFTTYGSKVCQVIVEVNSIMQATRKLHPVYGQNGESLQKQIGHEKNWCWWYDGDVTAWRFVYSPAPQHVVVTPHKDGYSEDRVSGIKWKYGLPRGGSPPIKHDGFYWSFFHSSIDISPTPPRRRYYMGAYAFDLSAPYAPAFITPEPLLVGSEEDPREPSAPYCVFPCGSYIDQGKWTVTFGVNDCACARTSITHEELTKLLVPV